MTEEEVTDRRSPNSDERPILLTEYEAMALLDIALLSQCELSPDQQRAVSKLSEFCRQFLRRRSTDEPREIKSAA